MAGPRERAWLGRRFVAYLVEVLPLTAAVFAVAWVVWPGFSEAMQGRLGPDGGAPAARGAFLEHRNVARNVALGLWLALAWLAEGSPWQASFGKRLLGLRVVTDEGVPLTRARSFQRTAAKSASLGLCGIGYLWVLWDRDGKTWHDRVAGTRVRPAKRAADFPPGAG